MMGGVECLQTEARGKMIEIQLRGFFTQLGFSEIFDQFEVIDSGNIIESQPWKRRILQLIKRFNPLRQIVLLFSPGTLFVTK